jgi:hypothetical protein
MTTETTPRRRSAFGEAMLCAYGEFEPEPTPEGYDPRTFDLEQAGQLAASVSGRLSAMSTIAKLDGDLDRANRCRWLENHVEAWRHAFRVRRTLESYDRTAIKPDTAAATWLATHACFVGRRVMASELLRVANPFWR